MESSTRFYDRRAIKTPLEMFAAELCKKAGVRYKGIQKGFGIQPDQIMFDNHYGSTLCCPIPGATVERIRAMRAESDANWKAQANAAD